MECFYRGRPLRHQAFDDAWRTVTTVTSSVTGTAYNDEALTDGTTYYYVISAFTSANLESASSTEVSATATDSSDLILQGVAGDGEVELGWVPMPGVNSYKIYQGVTTPSLLTTTTDTTYSVTGLTNNTSYDFYVVGYNSGVIVIQSNVVHLTPVLNPNSFAGFYNGVDDVTWEWYNDPNSPLLPEITGTGWFNGLPSAHPEGISYIWQAWAPGPNSSAGAGYVDVGAQHDYSHKTTNWFWVSYGDPAPWVTPQYGYPYSFLGTQSVSNNGAAYTGFDWYNDRSDEVHYVGPTATFTVGAFTYNNSGEVRDEFTTEQWLIVYPWLYASSPDSSSSAHAQITSNNRFDAFIENPRAYVP